MPKTNLNQSRTGFSHKISILFLIYFLAFQIADAQDADYFMNPVRYDFIHYDKNAFLNIEKNSKFNSFYEKLDSLLRFGDRQINILHFGGSHIQADIYTNQMRKRLTQLGPDLNAGRGLIFPVKMAKTNNPSNFSVHYTGNWDYMKCTKPGNDSLLGITGFSVSTTDTISTITVDPNRDSLIHYTYNHARIFHGPTKYKLVLKTSDSTYSGNYNASLGYTEFQLNDDQEILELEIRRDSVFDTFTLFGILIDNEASGILYNSVGVNGAMLSSYLHCGLLTQHLKVLSPDMVVFSIGTNEGNTQIFDSLAYVLNYRELISKIKSILPDAAILLTVPNDCYYRKRFTNKNTSVIRDIIYSLAEEQNCGVWDFYEVMGGYNSAQIWYTNHLMGVDRIHFNRDGYILKGDLFFSAFLRSWEGHISKNELILKSKKSTDLQAQATIQ